MYLKIATRKSTKDGGFGFRTTNETEVRLVSCSVSEGDSIWFNFTFS